MLLRKAEIVADLQSYTANTTSIHLECVSEMCQGTTAKNSNFKMTCITYNCPSPTMLLYSAESPVLYLSGGFATVNQFPSAPANIFVKYFYTLYIFLKLVRLLKSA